MELTDWCSRSAFNPRFLHSSKMNTLGNESAVSCRVTNTLPAEQQTDTHTKLQMQHRAPPIHERFRAEGFKTSREICSQNRTQQRFSTCFSKSVLWGHRLHCRMLPCGLWTLRTTRSPAGLEAQVDKALLKRQRYPCFQRGRVGLCWTGLTQFPLDSPQVRKWWLP